MFSPVGRVLLLFLFVLPFSEEQTDYEEDFISKHNDLYVEDEFDYEPVDKYLEWCANMTFPVDYTPLDYILRGFGLWLCTMMILQIIIFWYIDNPAIEESLAHYSTEDATGIDGSYEPYSPGRGSKEPSVQPSKENIAHLPNYSTEAPEILKTAEEIQELHDEESKKKKLEDSQSNVELSDERRKSTKNGVRNRGGGHSASDVSTNPTQVFDKSDAESKNKKNN